MAREGVLFEYVPILRPAARQEKKEMNITIYSRIMRSVLAISMSIAVITAACATDYHVAMDGDDANSGTSVLKPFRTIQRAADIMEPGDTCLIRAGRYHERVVIKNVTGSESQPVVFRAYKDEKVVLDGSEPITSKWTRHNENIFKTTPGKELWQLFVDGTSMSSARWPNGNWTDGSVWDKTTSMSWPEKEPSKLGHYYNDGLKDLGFGLADGGIVITSSGSFRTYKAFITEHEPLSDNFVFDTTDVREHTMGFGVDRHGYFIEGKLGLLDVEGEWFFEPKDGTLYLRPPGGTDPNALDVRGKTQSYAFDVSDSVNVKLLGLDFFGTTFRFDGCRHVTVENCNFLYPSYSRRMLRDMEPIHVTKLVVAGEFEPAYNTVRNCVFEYIDGPAIEMNGVGNLIENCYIHDVDYSCTYAGGFTLNMVNSPELTFRRNTIHTTGTSELFKAGVRNLIELNNLSHSGFLQNDGAMVQISVKQQDRSETRFNWAHHSVKQGYRFDNSNKPNSPWGENGRMHHNVAWAVQRSFFKGDKHRIYNNLMFDCELNDLSVSSKIDIQGRNFSTITRNNIAGTFSGHIRKPGADYPVPGTVDHNWTSDVTGRDIRTQLRDPDNLDFRPRAGSDLVDAGAIVEDVDHPYLGTAPDIGPYEFGDTCYWIPGRRAPHASTPVPPDEATSVKTDADLMFLQGYKSISHDVYFGTNAETVGRATRKSKEFKGTIENNIFCPGPVEGGRTYYWRVDARNSTGVVKGNVWKFEVEL